MIAVPRKLWAQEALSFQERLLKGYDPDLATEDLKRSVAYLLFSAKTPKDLVETYATLLSAHAYQKYINEERSKKVLYKDMKELIGFSALTLGGIYAFLGFQQLRRLPVRAESPGCLRFLSKVLKHTLSLGGLALAGGGALVTTQALILDPDKLDVEKLRMSLALSETLSPSRDGETLEVSPQEFIEKVVVKAQSFSGQIPYSDLESLLKAGRSGPIETLGTNVRFQMEKLYQFLDLVQNEPLTKLGDTDSLLSERLETSVILYRGHLNELRTALGL